MSNMSERAYSEETAKEIDGYVRDMIDVAHRLATEIVTQHRDKIELMTQMLIEFETLDRDDIHEIMTGTWNVEKKRSRLEASENLRKKSPAPVSSPEQGRLASDTMA